MAKLVHLFIDESGNADCNTTYIETKKITTHYLVGSAFFPSKRYKECQNKLKAILKGRTADALNEDETKSFLKELVSYEGRFGYVYVDKREICAYCYNTIKQLREGKHRGYAAYDAMMLLLLQNLIETENIQHSFKAYIHKFTRKPKELENGRNYVTDNVNSVLYPSSLFIEPKSEYEIFGIQCVDTVCWSIFEKLERQDPQYYEIIEDSTTHKTEFPYEELHKTSLS